MASVVVSAWMVEAKQSVIENMAPVLTASSPAFRRHPAAFLVAMIWTNKGSDVERDHPVERLLVILLGPAALRQLRSEPWGSARSVRQNAAHAGPQRFDHRRHGASGDHRPDH
jgi:hypothetical protein